MMMRMGFDSGSTLIPLRVQFARKWTQIGLWLQFEYTFLKNVTLNTLDLQFARILRRLTQMRQLHICSAGAPPLPRQDTSALCVGQRRWPGLEAGHTRTAPATLAEAKAAV